jgi:hypothetical protein
LNPYARPETPIQAGDTPRGAQLLSSIRQTPGGGRDLYASPDGGVYQRRNDGWYRHQSGGGWNFYAPLQGTIDPQKVAAARASQGAGAGIAYRPIAGATRSAGVAPRAPNSGFQAQAAQVADLERQYYARALAQARAQNWRGGNYARPARRGRR